MRAVGEGLEHDEVDHAALDRDGDRLLARHLGARLHELVHEGVSAGGLLGAERVEVVDVVGERRKVREERGEERVEGHR